jgi:hypothetical protein
MATFRHSFYEKTQNDLYKQKESMEAKSTPKDICYEVSDEKQDISIKFSNKDFTLYKNELNFLKINVENNSNAKLKRYSVFLDDFEFNLQIKNEKKDITKEKRGSKLLQNSINSNTVNNIDGFLNGNIKNLENPQIGNVSLFKFFHREIEIKKNEVNEVKEFVNFLIILLFFLILF